MIYWLEKWPYLPVKQKFIFLNILGQAPFIKFFSIQILQYFTDYVLLSSGISRSREHWLPDIARKWNKFLSVFYCFQNPSIAHNFETTGPIQVWVSAKCTSPNENKISQIENERCHDFRLISLDHITYIEIMNCWVLQGRILFLPINTSFFTPWAPVMLIG